jgi:hypothetical protein
MVLKKQGKNSMQIEKLIDPGVAMGHPQACGVVY